MKHKVLIKDYGFNEYTIGEGWGVVEIGNVSLRVFITGLKLPRILYEKDYRGEEIEVDLRILKSYITRMIPRKKMVLELTSEEDLVPKYLFMGEVIEKIEKSGDEIAVVFDSGIKLDVNVEKKYYSERLKRGDYILVIGFLHMYGVGD